MGGRGFFHNPGTGCDYTSDKTRCLGRVCSFKHWEQ